MTVNQSVWKVNEFKGEVFSSLVGGKKGESIKTLSDLILKLIRFPLSSCFFLISPSERNRLAD